MEPLFHYQFRFILIGDSTVGKSSLLKYFTEGKFAEVCDPTVGVDFYARLVEIRPGLRIKLQLWDTAGQEKFRSITRSYYRNSVGVIVVYDITKRESFEHVAAWLHEARANIGVDSSSCVFLLVGHKADLDSQRQVLYEEGEYFAKYHQLKFVETSVMSGINVEEAFLIIAREVYRKVDSGEIPLEDGWDGVKSGFMHRTSSISLSEGDNDPNAACYSEGVEFDINQSDAVNHHLSLVMPSDAEGREAATVVELERGLVTAKSWTQLREHVRYWRRRGRQAMLRCNWANFKFRTVTYGDVQKTRLYCLGMTSDDREHTLLFLDVPGGDCAQERLILTPLLKNEKRRQLEGLGKVSKEEELRRERMRCTISGITNYQLDPDGCFLFTVGSHIVTAQDATLKAENVIGRQVNIPESHTVIDPQPCPGEIQLLAFASDGDVYLSFRDACKRATSYKTSSETPRYAGTPSFIIQEEFDRYSSMWWAPKELSKKTGLHHLLIEVTDEGAVIELSVSVPASLRGEVENMRYPRAGTENAASTFKLLEILVDPSQESDALVVGELGLARELRTLFPWFEYIVRAGWLPDGSAVWAQLMSRKQNRLALVLLPLTLFISTSGSMQDLTQAADVPVTVLIDEEQPTYINYHDFLHFLPSETGRVRFVWSSEKSGYDHIYVIESELAAADACGCEEWCSFWRERFRKCLGKKAVASSESHPKGPSIVSETPITSGDWPIKRKVEPVIDEERGLIYFMGLKDSFVESHIYVASLTQPGLIRRLTELGKSDGSHRGETLCFDTVAGLFVVWRSNLREQPACNLYRLSFSDSDPLPKAHFLKEITAGQSSPVANQFPSLPMETGEPPQMARPQVDWLMSLGPDPRDRIGEDLPEIIEYQNPLSGFRQYSMLIPPHNYRRGVKYPTLVYCYGGPEVQLVKNAWHTFASFQKFTSLGYAVVMTDGRGSAGRGYAFEAAVAEKMGLVEVVDQVEGLKAVSKACGDLVDFDRVAITGWSYGGYLSLQALIQRPDVFKVAIAGGPVTSWTLYDTGYTERYMGLPQEKDLAYANGSILNVAHKFPDEPGRLLILHGLIDENVHFKHTAKLIEHLTRNGKPYDLLVFPRERHGVRSPEANEHMDVAILNYLQRNLF